MSSGENAELRRFDESRILRLTGLSELKLYDPETVECLQHEDAWPIFVESKHPEVSILITTYNRLGYVFNCLQSLKATCYAYDGKYEVIVVDDGSTDRTGWLLSKIHGLRVLSSKRNMGFVGANNLGAREARGQYVILLNNDTIVTSGWLEFLVKTFRKEQFGAVGSKLVYPSSVLQEAGSIIWNDATGWNYGRYDNAAKSDYQHIRDVDYCSAASLAVHRSLIRRTGVFDERFSPGYYEDADLCFYVRSKRKRVLYQPKSVVIHFEGVSHGREVTRGMKKYQEINRVKFAQKWGRELRLQYPPEHRNVIHARDRASRRSILVFDHRAPEHDNNSGDLRMFSILQILRSLSWNVTFFPANRACTEPYTEDLRQSEIEVICEPDVTEFLRQRRSYYDFILLSRTAVAKEYFDTVALWSPQSVLVVDFPDLESVSEATHAKLRGNGQMASVADAIALEELKLARRADLTITVTEEERRHILDRDRSLRVEVVPNIHKLRMGGLRFDKRKDLLFVGGFEHPPNVDSVQFMVEEIFPLVRKQIPEAQFFVVGSKMPAVVRNIRAKQVRVLGFVKDLTPLLNSCKVFVCPLRYGAGLKGKIGMAMAAGLPVVSTPIGAQGIDMLGDGPMLVANDVHQFAEYVVNLYTNPKQWMTLSKKARSYAKRWSPDVVRKHISEIFARAYPVNLENRIFPELENVAMSMKELQEIRASFIFRVFKRITSSIDNVFPDGTSRGEFRLIVVTSLGIISKQGWSAFLKQAYEKIRKRQFHVIR